MPASDTPEPDVTMLIRRGASIQSVAGRAISLDLIARVENGGRRSLSVNTHVEAVDFDVDQFIRPYSEIALESPISKAFILTEFCSIYACNKNQFSLGLSDVAFQTGDQRYLRFMNHRYENHADRVWFAEQLTKTDPILGAYFWNLSHPLLAGESEYWERP